MRHGLARAPDCVGKLCDLMGLRRIAGSAIAAAGKSAVIPPRPDRVTPRQFDREYKEYKERHLIENLFSKLKQPAP
jgi:hypothetical protein